MAGCGKKQKASSKKDELPESEEIQIDPDSTEVKEESDGSKTYTTSDGKTVKVTSNGTASVIKTEVINTETGEVVASKPSSGSSSNNSSTGGSSSSNSSGSSTETKKPTKPSAPTTPTETTCDHSWDGGTVTKAATCTATGVKTYTCTKCGKTKTEDIACI